LARVIDVDLTGVIYCIKHKILAMKKTGGGSIVNTVSAAGLRAETNAADYVGAKFGVVGLTQAAAIDGGQLGVRVNAVCPGLNVTPTPQDRIIKNPVFAKALRGIRAQHHFRHFDETEDIGSAAMWLLSDISGLITGTPFTVDGGYCA
jgi:NAD(P)-dependent dehydrogenase (short-subunit alcohol dehydrogenase family)